MTTSLLRDHSSLAPLIPHLKSYASKGLNELLAGNTVIGATAIEVYAANVAEKVEELDSAIGSLRIAMGYILDMSSESDIGSATYRYHYENFLIRAVGTLDRSCRLVGASFLYDARQYESSRGNAYVRDRVKAQDYAVYKALIAVEEVVRRHRALRNVVVHSGAFSSRELGLFSAVEVFKLDLPSSIDAKALMHQHFYLSGAEVAVVINGLIDALHVLLEALSPTYLAAHEASA